MDRINTLLAAAKPMTDAEREQQIESLAIGNVRMQRKYGDRIQMDITNRAYQATLDLLERTSKAPSTSEIAAMAEAFALEFAADAATRMLGGRINEDTVQAVKNAVDRAAKGEP